MTREEKRSGIFLTAIAVIGAFFLVMGHLSLVREETKIKAMPVCKICHCGKTSCHRECDGDMMCMLKCENLCNKK